MRAFRSILGWKNHDMVAEQKCVRHEDGPNERDKMETQVRTEVFCGTPPRQSGRKGDVTAGLLKMMRQPLRTKKEAEFPGKNERIDSLGTRSADDRQGSDVGKQRPQNGGGLDQQSCHAEDVRLYYCGRSESNVGLAESRVIDLRRRVADWAEHYCRERVRKKADVWAGIGVRGRTEEWVANVNVVWTEVTGLCGFFDRICQ